MLHVDLDNILTHDELAHKAEEVLRKADDEGKIVVITRNGRPAVAVLKLEQLEELSGRTVSTNQQPVEIPGVETGAPHPSSAPAEPSPVAEMPADAPRSDLPDMPEDRF